MPFGALPWAAQTPAPRGGSLLLVLAFKAKPLCGALQLISPSSDFCTITQSEC